ncbi:hypothetical protein A2707_04455 [Candidatus Saccharibacteria bacterium RIFCSPHIGHO2_01_FULL_45_15]|nr:MAG: hypothetical protein A2707_04455 [Candidatus Saccharibacteria bacterium RIFCSPHIGHO2_01_FULL_45_15]OGL27187.1 MAG: hypothetical protein A3C39_01340 [Candidatus Saccharibacteria bacterium RIFCSPHIGHO2_02_FULL_46_12]OGL32770.1 MAG: hypothetical protein A3E76_05505 [Candidatus Saccharibacteria bacterium RIFCSPHIGHO2_12_FULL_44_22]
MISASSRTGRKQLLGLVLAECENLKGFAMKLQRLGSSITSAITILLGVGVLVSLIVVVVGMALAPSNPELSNNIAKVWLVSSLCLVCVGCISVLGMLVAATARSVIARYRRL